VTGKVRCATKLSIILSHTSFFCPEIIGKTVKLLVETLVAYGADVQGVFGQRRKQVFAMSPSMNLNW
jgi:hypothetical protein